MNNIKKIAVYSLLLLGRPFQLDLESKTNNSQDSK